MDQGNSKVGMASASLEKYIFNYRYIERLETDSVVGKIRGEKEAEELGLRGIASMLQMGIQPEKRGARKKRHGGISLSRN